MGAGITQVVFEASYILKVLEVHQFLLDKGEENVQ